MEENTMKNIKKIIASAAAALMLTATLAIPTSAQAYTDENGNTVVTDNDYLHPRFAGVDWDKILNEIDWDALPNNE